MANPSKMQDDERIELEKKIKQSELDCKQIQNKLQSVKLTNIELKSQIKKF